ncbi:hypothetical protein BT96DRAFT_925916 [Gymnopus androsaceus JB14]|uniref:Meiotically up-regulated protein Msb1/Mug8 domain-containing protein n=1 Tax=Gymnopus androsaceus JB14 TaxID=1447944 RepID=A0A6A4GY63_9AGAR|nr:hypothetical protein BT96DRAFT_925916 [Gymnopus androsaceus JB14]
MPSLFSRSTRSHHPQTPPGPSSRVRTDASGQFLETSAGSSNTEGGSITSSGGHLSPYPTLTLSLTHLETLVSVVSETLDVSTPFVFSTDAMDLDAGRVRRLIDKFVGIVCSVGASAGKGAGAGREAFLDEARFAGPHELGMLLRWGLARVVRVETMPAPSSSTPPGTSTPSTATTQTLSPGALIPYLAYLNWAAEEHRLGYPPAHFAQLLDTMVKVPKQSVAPRSRCTPPTLAPLFGILVFGLDASASGLASSSSPNSSLATTLGSPSHPFTATYTSYLRSTHAMEHLLLSFIRWQDTPVSLGGGGIGVGGVPTRCKEWVMEYPRELSNHNAVLALMDGGGAHGERGALGPRQGAKTLRVVSVKRTVPVYDGDLVTSCGRWDQIGIGAGAGQPSSSYTYTLAGSEEWKRISPQLLNPSSKDKARDKEKLPPRYSDSYRKRMNIPVGVEPGVDPLALSMSRPRSSNSSYGNTSSTYGYRRGSYASTFTYGLGSALSGGSTPTSPSAPNGKDSSERFKTPTDAQWRLFESSGFLSSPSTLTPSGSASALKFDLTESAWKARLSLNSNQGGSGPSGREGVSWGDFVSAGFDAREGDRDGGVLTGTGAGETNYGVAGMASPGRGLWSAGSSGGGTEYLDTKGKPTDVGEFTLDTEEWDAALQEFGSLRDKDQEREKERERERERTGSFGLAKRLKKKGKPLPPFTHDTTPLLGTEALVEAAFVDVWVDLVCWGFAGGSTVGMEGIGFNTETALTLSRSIGATGKWDDEEREREQERERERERWRNDLFRECNWALVEFKALPSSKSTSSNANANANSPSLRINTNIGGCSSANASTSSDPRTSTSLLLFEEYVPREYRAQLAHQILGIHPSVILDPSANAIIATSPSSRIRFGSLFANSFNVSVSTASLNKKDKMGGGLFSRSMRTLTSSAPTSYNNPRNDTATPTPTPYDSRSGATPTPPCDSRNGSSTPQPTEFDAMLADGNNEAKVINLARDGSQRDSDLERTDYEVDCGARPISRTISLHGEDDEGDEGEYTGGGSSAWVLPEGAMSPGSAPPLPPVPTTPTAATSSTNLVPAEYHTVEFETRLMDGDDSADNDSDAYAGSGGENLNPGLGETHSLGSDEACGEGEAAFGEKGE